MKFEFFIAKRLLFNEKGKQSVSRPAVQIATIGIAVGLTVMILAVSIIIGFKREIQEKVIGFGSHIQITHYDRNQTYETFPITVPKKLREELSSLPEVKHLQEITTKPGIIKTESDFLGVVIKGVGSDFDWTFLKKHLTEGNVPIFNDTILQNGTLISRTIANTLGLKTGDSFLAYFMQENARVRKFQVEGIYDTNIAEYDKLFILTDIQHIQRLNGWEKDQVSGIEILLQNYDQLETVADEVFLKTSNRFDENGSTYYTQTIKQLNPHIFGWLDLLDMNTWVILVLMLSVAGFNIISGLLILILERTNSIGILKAMGVSNWSIRKVFLYQSVFLVGKGMLYGNIIGVSLCLIQYFTHVISLDPEAYYVSTVPISLDPWYWFLLNIGTAVLSVLMLIGPSVVITRILPAKVIRFE